MAEDILKVAERLKFQVEDNKSVLVLGTRNFDKPDVPFKSKFGNNLTSRVFKLLYGKNSRDTQTGLRGISNYLVNNLIDLNGERFEYEINMLAYAASHNALIVEEEIQTVYINSNRETHFRPIIDSLKIYFVFIKYLLASIVTAITDYIIFVIIFALSQQLALSTVIARFGGAGVSFLLQKDFVFASNQKILPALIKFVSLVIFSGCVSYSAVRIMQNYFSASVYILKPLSELLLYFANYFIQKSFIFKN